MANVSPGYVFTGPTDPITYAKLNLLGQPTVTIGTSEVTTTMIADNAVTLAKLATVATGTLLGRKTAATGNVEAIVINNTAITQPTTGFVIGSTSIDSYLYIGQSATAHGYLKWDYNATEASSYLELATYSQQLSIKAGSLVYTNLTNGLFPFLIDTTSNVAVGTPSIATNATTGFFYIPVCAGTPTGVPTTFSGRVPMVFDSTGVKFWIYSGGWKGVVVS